MGKEQEPTTSNYLVPSSGQALARRSDALVARGIRDLEAIEQTGDQLQHAKRFMNRVSQSYQLHQARQRTERILIVNDEKVVQEIISSILTLAGYECRAVAGGLEALALLDSGEQFDLVLTDMLNYPLDGLSLLQCVKERFPDLPVVVASAISDEAVVEECIRNGAYEYLFLPLERQQLLVTVSSALEDRRIKLENHK